MRVERSRQRPPDGTAGKDVAADIPADVPAGVPAGTGTTGPPAGVLANRDFVKLWLGETVSLTGTQITQLALPLVAVLTLHATVGEVGVLNATRYAPVVFFSLVAGVWLDTRQRRPTLIGAGLACAVLIGLVPVAYAAGVLSIGLLWTLAFLVGVPQVFFDIGVLAYLPGLVERRHLASANSKLQISFSAASIAGPSLAGLLVGILTAPVTLVVNAGSYLFSMLMLLAIRKPEIPPEVPAERPSVTSSIAEGLRAVFGSRLLRALLAQSCTFNVLASALVPIFVVYAIRTLGLSPTELGLVLGAGAVAALVAAIVTTRMLAALGLGRTLLVSTVGCCLSPLLLLVPGDASLPALVLLGVAQAGSAVSLVVWNVTTVTLRQVVTPDRLLARMNASYRLLLWGAGPVGALAGGALGSALGLRGAMVATALALITPAIWIFFSPAFRLREMPTGPEEPTDAAGAAPTGAEGSGGGPRTVGEDREAGARA